MFALYTGRYCVLLEENVAIVPFGFDYRVRGGLTRTNPPIKTEASVLVMCRQNIYKELCFLLW